MTITNQTLKNAARALGYDLWSDPDGSHYLVDYDGVKLKRWDPEHNSGDSFELMVFLKIDIDQRPGFGNVCASDGGRYMLSLVEYTGNLAQDTRTAILLCAAQIGESLCQS